MPLELLDIVSWYAMNDPDPEKELWRTPAEPNGQPYYGGNPLHAGINSVRGAAADAIARLIEHSEDRIENFKGALHRLVQDSSIAVRAVAAACLVALLRYDRKLAVDLFKTLCDAEDKLLESHYVSVFLRHGLITQYNELLPIVKRMVEGDSNELNEDGASLVRVTALSLPEAQHLVDFCLEQGSRYHRCGVAEVYSRCVPDSRFQSVCENPLTTLFFDGDANVREKAALCFNHFEDDQLGSCTSLLTNFVDSPAFNDNHQSLMWALQNTTAKLPDLTIGICEHLLSLPDDNYTWRDDSAISQLILREYQQAAFQELKSKCLDIVDTMAAKRVHALNTALDAYER